MQSPLAHCLDSAAFAAVCGLPGHVTVGHATLLISTTLDSSLHIRIPPCALYSHTAVQACMCSLVSSKCHAMLVTAIMTVLTQVKQPAIDVFLVGQEGNGSCRWEELRL